MHTFHMYTFHSHTFHSLTFLSYIFHSHAFHSYTFQSYTFHSHTFHSHTFTFHSCNLKCSEIVTRLPKAFSQVKIQISFNSTFCRIVWDESIHSKQPLKIGVPRKYTVFKKYLLIKFLDNLHAAGIQLQALNFTENEICYIYFSRVLLKL